MKTDLYVVRSEDPANMIHLEAADQEAEDVRKYSELLSMDSRIVVGPEPETFLEFLKSKCKLIHYIGHGQADEVSERLFLKEGRWFPAEWLKGLTGITSPLIFLSACEVGRSRSILSGGSTDLSVKHLIKDHRV